MCERTKCKRVRGSPNYMDFQQFRFLELGRPIDWNAADIWSFGCLTYTMANNKKPLRFQAEAYEDFKEREPIAVFKTSTISLSDKFKECERIVKMCLDPHITTRTDNWKKLVKYAASRTPFTLPSTISPRSPFKTPEWWK